MATVGAAWLLVAGALAGQPHPESIAWLDALEDHEGRAHVFGLAVDGSVWHATEDGAPAALDTLTSVRGDLKQLRVAITSSGSIQLLALDSRGRPLAARWTPGAGVQWHDLGLDGQRGIELSAWGEQLAAVLIDIKGRMRIVGEKRLQDPGARVDDIELPGSAFQAADLAVDAKGRVSVVAVHRDGRVVAFEAEVGRGYRGRPETLGEAGLEQPQVVRVSADKSVALWRTRDKKFSLSERTGGPESSWVSLPPLSSPPRADAGVSRLLEIESGIYAVALIDKEGSAIQTLGTAAGTGREWIELPSLRTPIASILRRRNGTLQIFGADIFRFVQGSIEITSVKPEIPWEEDVLRVEYKVTNRRPTSLAGQIRAILGNQAMTAAPPSLLPLAPGATSSIGAFTSSALTVGDHPLRIEYLDHVGTLKYPHPLSGKFIERPLYEVVFSHSRTLRVKSFTERYDTDDPEISGGSFACLDAPTSDLVLSTSRRGICDMGQSIVGAECPQPVDPPVITSYNHLVGCGDGLVLSPRTIEEVQAALELARLTSRSVRVVGNRHSANRILCTDGILLTTEEMRGETCDPATNANCGALPECSWSPGPRDPLRDPDHLPCLESLDGQRVVQVRPGASLFGLAERLYASGWSLGYAIPGFREASVGGAIATGTHGSSPSHPAVLSSRVRSVTLVRADGTVETRSGSSNADNVMRALRANLGYLGVVVRIGLLVEPAFDLSTSIRWFDDAPSEFEKPGAPFSLVQGCDFGQMIWFPGAGNQLLVMCGKRVPAGSQGDAENRALQVVLPSLSLLRSIPGLSSIEDPSPAQMAPWLTDAACGCAFEIEGNCVLDSCLLEKMRAAMLRHIYPPLTDTDCGNNAPAAFLARVAGSETLAGSGCEPTKVGRGHRMMSSSLNKEVLPLLQQRDWEIFIAGPHAQEALRFSAKYFSDHHTCLPMIGVFLRFAPAEEATLLAHTTAQGPFVQGEPGMFFEMPVVLPKRMRCSEQERYEAEHLQLAEALVEQFKGRAHWGKNSTSLFQKQRRLGVYGENLRTFRAQVRAFDPGGMFANRFGHDLGLRWPDRPSLPEMDASSEACIP